MDFVSNCGCDGGYGHDCGFVGVACFFFFLVVDFVADCECGCDRFCGFFLPVALAVVAGSGWAAKKRKRCSRCGGQRRER